MKSFYLLHYEYTLKSETLKFGTRSDDRMFDTLAQAVDAVSELRDVVNLGYFHVCHCEVVYSSDDEGDKI